jgi:rhamnopyranosyl-N-acetylglucosaminyl-diphospho-decaprenol beta-1,3/1,4-galactofuranosyltransferase
VKQTVCAVVVTYNRRELLRECVVALRNQIRTPEQVLVVDNASTDGTVEMLREEFSGLEVLQLPTNQGAAAGFHSGMKRAYEAGFDWLWLMDDDGFAAPDSLAALLKEKDYGFKGSLLLARNANTTAAFPYPLPERGFTSEAEAIVAAYPDGRIPGFLHPYNGCLVSRAVIERIGLPLKSLLMWGDETEYFLRSKRAGIKSGTVLDSRFFHPENRQKCKEVRIMGKTFALLYAEDREKFSLVVRNQAYIYTRYISVLRWLVMVLAYLIAFPKERGLTIRACWQGMRGSL